MMRKILKAFGLILSGQLLSLPIPAQSFQNLATTADGSVLYFSTSSRQKGTSQRFDSKIFRWTAATGVQLVAEGPEAINGCVSPTFSQLRAPQVSLDGSVVGYTASRTVRNSPFCAPGEPNMGTVMRSGQTILLDGNAALSPNGRYAITTTAAPAPSQLHAGT